MYIFNMKYITNNIIKKKYKIVNCLDYFIFYIYLQKNSISIILLQY